MPDLIEDSLRIQKESDQARLDFIRTDLDVILTFVSIAETEYKMGNRARAEQTLASAEKGYSEMLRYFSMVKGLTSGIAGEIQSKFKQVRERLDQLERFR